MCTHLLLIEFRTLVDKTLRDHCSEEQKRLSAFSGMYRHIMLHLMANSVIVMVPPFTIVAASMRIDVFRAVKGYAESDSYRVLRPDGQQRRFVCYYHHHIPL
jgi:hypothetical protein